MENFSSFLSSFYIFIRTPKKHPFMYTLFFIIVIFIGGYLWKNPPKVVHYNFQLYFEKTKSIIFSKGLPRRNISFLLSRKNSFENKLFSFLCVSFDRFLCTQTIQITPRHPQISRSGLVIFKNSRTERSTNHLADLPLQVPLH